MSNVESRRSPRRGDFGFTLVELLVAVALMVILTGSIIIIFQQTTKLFSAGERATVIFQNVRGAFEVMARDFDNVRKTHDQEFFKDKGRPRNGHYDPATEVVLTGQFSFTGMPLKLKKYTCSMTFVGGDYEDERFNRDEKLRSDALYFRSASMIDGEVRACLMVYMLQPASNPDVKSMTPRVPEHPTLKKYTLFIDPRSRLLVHKEEDLCCYVQSFRVEYYFDDPLDNIPPEWWGPKPGFVKELAYRGVGSITADGCLKVNDQGFDPPPSPPPDGALMVDRFSQLAPGDAFYIFNKATEDWSPGYNKDYAITAVDRRTKPPLIAFNKADSPPADTLQVSFRAGYLPPAVRITMQVVDRDRRQVRTFRRIFRFKSK